MVLERHHKNYNGRFLDLPLLDFFINYSKAFKAGPRAICLSFLKTISQKRKRKNFHKKTSILSFLSFQD